MTKTQRNIIVIATLIVCGVLVFIIFARKKRSKAITDLESQESTSLEVVTLDKNKMLKQGVQGEEVKQLQRMINKALDQSVFSLAYLNVDGDFGPKTENASLQVFGLDQLTLTDAENSFTNILNIG